MLTDLGEACMQLAASKTARMNMHTSDEDTVDEHQENDAADGAAGRDVLDSSVIMQLVRLATVVWMIHTGTDAIASYMLCC